MPDAVYPASKTTAVLPDPAHSYASRYPPIFAYLTAKDAGAR
jgi:hypothetical protein